MNKKQSPLLYVGLGVVLIVVVGLLIFLANQPQNDETSTQQTTQTSTQSSEPTGIDGKKTSQTSLDKLKLPQLTDTVGKDEAEVEIQTSAGNIKIKLFPKLAPLAVENFLTLAKEDYYKNNEFFRVIKNFMIQTGDPSNQGTGSKSVVNDNQPFATEISNQLYNIRGALSLANTGQANSSSSQFFIVQNAEDMSSQLSNFLRPSKIEDAYKKGGYPSLDGSYTVFGQVISGMDVVDKIASAEVETNSSGESSSPVKPEKITGIKVIKDWKF
ncbi:peptidylprolyl isomerase [Lactococcus taiwanensis]|uniref:peptidylprolyl isomerase n=1 Tax=Lactococcus taiwanensis TaxID=1151742 RepID=UPI0028AC661C|nr:peptidylprolyl isomerase [Lactococcus taiwanensis]